MSLLTRFRKQGGFIQLLQLVETSAPSRQTELLAMIGKEDPGWAHLIRVKSLTVGRILGWPLAELGKIWMQTPVPLIVILWHRATPEEKRQIELSLPRNFSNAFKTAQEEKPEVSEAEASIAGLKLISLVRELWGSGQIRFQDCDPTLELDGAMADQLDPFRRAA